MMGMPFLLLVLGVGFALLFVLTLILIILFNYIQPEIFQKYPIDISWKWAVILPIIIIGFWIVYEMTYSNEFLN
jgi:uncharacterized BrkB/YihY/UPF0761 family membrane protein